MGHSSYTFLSDEGHLKKTCVSCGCRIPMSSPYDKCKECIKKELFPKVKEFITENYDVNEMIVAQEFGIDRSIIHEWIQDGDLEYRKTPPPYQEPE